MRRYDVEADEVAETLSGEAKEGLIDQLLANSKLPAGHYVMY